MRRVREPAPSRRRGRVYVLGRLMLLVAALCLAGCSDRVALLRDNQPLRRSCQRPRPLLRCLLLKP